MNRGTRFQLALALATCCIGALAPGAARAQTQAVQATVGQPAPDFTLVDETGVSHTLSEYRGHIVVLEWTNPDCPFVQRCYGRHAMQETAATAMDQGVVWLAIDSSHDASAATTVAWKSEQGLQYPTLQDRDGTVGHLYGARTTPHMFVIDALGILRYEGAIDDNPRGTNDHPTNYVSEAVTALLAGQDPPVTTTQSWGCHVDYGEDD